MIEKLHAAARAGRHPDRRRQLVVRGHAPPRSGAAGPAGIHFVGCGVSGGEEGARYGPSLMPGGSDEAWARIKRRARGDRREDRGGPVRDARRARRRRALRQDGPQRHRVRRHAAHRRGVRRAAPRARPDDAGDGRRLRRVEPRPARVVPRRADRAGLPRRSTRRPGSRSSTSSRTRPARRARASGPRRSRSIWPSRSRRSPRRSTRACCPA